MVRQMVGFVLIFAAGLSQSLPSGSTALFRGSADCASCHSPGATNPLALVNAEGQDISPAALWQSSMMAQAAKDPFWQAKVQAEINDHPELQLFIEDKCTTCHAPLGRTEAHYQGSEYYGISEMLADPLALDGVSCSVCHQIQNPSPDLAGSFSGHYGIENDRQIFGPFQNPVSGPMQNSINYFPVYSGHMTESELCATCHTLFTPYLNDAGEILGEAPEQVPYLEWLNSRFPQDGIECQTCHMPAESGPIPISDRPPWLNGRDPLHKHEFVGGNVFMLRLMRDHLTESGLTTTQAHLDSTIGRTLYLLTHQTVELSLETDWDQDTLDILVDLQNLSGHKFPSAYPSRRAWLELKLENVGGEILFHSGRWDATGEIVGLDSIYEPHYDVISDQDQVLVYQNIPRDVNGQKTYKLLRIADYLKDNRIPPEGYLDAGPAGDSTRILGRAQSDPNFNRRSGSEGSGSDQIRYRIGDLDPSQVYRIQVAVNYQTLAPRFAQDLFSYDLPEVERFRMFYEAMDQSPIRLAQMEFDLTSNQVQPGRSILPESGLLVSSYPNPFNPETSIIVDTPRGGHLKLRFFDLQGRLVEERTTAYLPQGRHSFIWDSSHSASPSSGIYLLKVEYLGSDPTTRRAANHKLLLLR